MKRKSKISSFKWPWRNPLNNLDRPCCACGSTFYFVALARKALRNSKLIPFFCGNTLNMFFFSVIPLNSDCGSKFLSSPPLSYALPLRKVVLISGNPGIFSCLCFRFPDDCNLLIHCLFLTHFLAFRVLVILRFNRIFYVYHV